MRRRALEDSSATTWGPKILGFWHLGIQVAEVKRLSGEEVAFKEGC